MDAPVRLPRIGVAVCAFGDIHHEALDSFVVWFATSCVRYNGRFELYWMPTPNGKEQYRARNALCSAALEGGMDYVLMLDDDQLPHICPDMIGKFYNLGKPLAGGLYFQRGGLYHPVVMRGYDVEGQRRYRFYHPDELPKEPAIVDVVGHGCHWVAREVLEKTMRPLHWPYPREVCFVPDETYGLDVDFCQRAKAAGYDMWFHPGVHVGHVARDRLCVDIASRPPQAQIEASERYKQYMATLERKGLHLVPMESAA